MTHVDDCVIVSPNKSLIDDWIADVKKDCTLEDEGDINACLGANVTRPNNESFKLNQPTLIKRIIDSLGLKDGRQHDTPADSILHRDKEGES